ncbi:glycosyltransferase family 39 protein [Candidatus Sumerlaeota bacterium]|nr:glycosyltransferase family 39 protein [Candidatus Sumerlaeota bacterium]
MDEASGTSQGRVSVRTVRLAVGFSLGAVALAAHWPLFHAGLFVSDEELHWLRRLSEFDFTIHQGQWWPRWFPNLEWGHGYPYPNFYAPGGLWVSWFFLLLSASYLTGVKAAFLFAGLLAPFGMYRWLRPRVSRMAAVAGALLYLLAPYHLLNIFVRGNLAEYLAMGLFPWVLWGFERLAAKQKAKDIALASVLLCLFQLTHTLSALFGTGFLVGWLLLRLLVQRPSQSVLISSAVTLGVGTLLGAIYWLPALWDARYVRVATLAEQIVAADHVIYPWQLLDPRWGWGYSVPGPADQISLQMGLPQFAAVVLALGALWRGRGDRKSLLVWTILFIALILLLMPISVPLWQLPLMRMIQFPWRLLAWVAVAAAALGAMGLDAWGFRGKVIWAIVIVICLTTLVFARAEFFREVNNINFIPEVTREHFRGNTGEDDYLPKWVLEKPGVPSLWRLLSRDPQAEIEFQGDEYFDRRWVIVSPSGGLVRYDIYRYPNWRISIDGEPIDDLTSAMDGTIVFPCPPGSHVIRIRWVATPVQCVATGISLLTALGLLFAMVGSTLRSRRGAIADEGR